jgi:hypothetical protein
MYIARWGRDGKAVAEKVVREGNDWVYPESRSSADSSRGIHRTKRGALEAMLARYEERLEDARNRVLELEENVWRIKNALPERAQS